MTSYTRHRGYPYPSTDREMGNGAVHSEELARAVARDLDVVDADWAAELQKPTSILTRSADISAYFNANQELSVPYDTVEHASTGVGLTASPGSGSFFVPAGAAGWYHFMASLRTIASGTVTAAARHRLAIVRQGNLFNTFQTIESRPVETYQATGQEVYNTVECVMHVDPGDSVIVTYFHVNASNMTMRSAMSRFSGSLIFAG